MPPQQRMLNAAKMLDEGVEEPRTAVGSRGLASARVGGIEEERGTTDQLLAVSAIETTVNTMTNHFHRSVVPNL